VKAFLEHLYRQNLSFVCEKCGDEASLKTFSIENAWNRPATRRDLSLLESLAGAEAEFLKSLYLQHNGIALYQNGETTGVYFPPIADLKDLNEMWKDWFDDIDATELRDFENNGFAFAEISQSGNLRC
jgi:hypothetical protein